MLNRPSETTVGDSVPQLEDLVDLDEQLFVGGPVQPSSVIVLAEFDDPTDAALLAFDDVGVLGHRRGAGGARRGGQGRAGRSSVTPAGAPDSSTPSSTAPTGSSSRPSARTPSRTEPRELWSDRC